jgi:16S rRNA (cytidine1402-2'-O)-methyltransferase
MATGKIFLIPSFISPAETKNDLPATAISKILELDVFVVEEIKTARRFLRRTGYVKDFTEVTFHVLNEHTDPADIADYLTSPKNGKDIGIISEAGLPCIADPGSELVMLAHRSGIRVVPLSGSGSIFLALMASGLNGQKFTFHGYLIIDKSKRRSVLRELESEIRKSHYTQVFIETPYRNMQLFESILSACSDDLQLCIACNLASEEEFITTKSIAQWKKEKPDLDKKPAVFLLNI